MTKLSVIIPAYNERPTVEKLLQQVIDLSLPEIEKEILVVESGSTDGTREVVQAYEAKKLIRAFYEDRPRGKGFAVRHALPEATGDIVLIQDADLEYRVSEYPELLAPLVEGRADFVLGSRHLGAGTWKMRHFVHGRLSAWVFNVGNMACTQSFNFLYGTRLTDPTTMFKVFRRKFLEGVVLRSNYFQIDWEIVAKLLRRGCIPLEVPITYASRTFEEGKKIRLWRDGPLALYAMIRFRWCD